MWPDALVIGCAFHLLPQALHAVSIDFIIFKVVFGMHSLLAKVYF